LNGERKKCEYKVKNAMHRIFCRYDQYRKEYGQKRDEVKCIHVYIYKIPMPVKELGKGIKLLY